jgi:hypothetical protein
MERGSIESAKRKRKKKKLVSFKALNFLNVPLGVLSSMI